MHGGVPGLVMRSGMRDAALVMRRIGLVAPFALALVVPGCKDDAPPDSQASDSSDGGADDDAAADSSDGGVDDGGTTAAEPADGPTFYGDVLPIFIEQCAGCHTDDGAGNGPGLVGVGALYLGDAGTPEAARERLLAYLKDPLGVPGLLRDPRPADAMAGLVATLKDAERDDLVAFLLSRTGKKPVAER